MNATPPPVIDSARLRAFAVNDDEVRFTGRLSLYVGDRDELNPISESPALAICQDYRNPDEYFLFHCDHEWNSRGVQVYSGVDAAMRGAEVAYAGLAGKWQTAPYSEEETDEYLRTVYEVDPQSEWWVDRCSFCGRDDAQAPNMIMTARASICSDCAASFHEQFEG